MAIGVSEVDFVMVQTTDIDRAVDFYENTLGLRRSMQWGEMPAWEFETDNLTLVVADPRGFGQEFAPSATTIALRVPDVAAARAELQGRGVVFFDDTLDSGVCHMAFFADPDGNPMMLHHRYAPREDATSTA